MKSKYINTFNTTAEYDAYIDSAYPEFPNVGYDKQAGEVIIRRTSPNNYQIWGTTTATSNFNIKLNNTNVEVTVDTLTGEFYLTGWTGTLTSLSRCFEDITHITSINKFALDTSNVTQMDTMFYGNTSLTSINLLGLNTSHVTNINSIFSVCSSLKSLNLLGCDFSQVNNINNAFNFTGNNLKDVYIDVESTLMKLTNNLSSQGSWQYIPSSATIHYNDVDYKWQNNAWTPQS